MMKQLPTQDQGVSEARAGAGSGDRSGLTLLILSGWSGRRRGIRRVRLPGWAVALLVLAGSALVLAGFAAPHLWLRATLQSTTIDRLGDENRALRGERDRFEESLAEVRQRLDTFERQASHLAEELDVDSVAPFAGGGAGGEAPGESDVGERWFDVELRALDSRSESLESSFDALGEAFRERMSVLASTPDGMPVEGWFSHGYGWRKDPFTGERAFHRGIDIVVAQGTEIVAPADGVISRTGRFPSYGKSLDVSHGHGYVTRYAHLSEVLARPGQRVRRGDVLGRVGATGRATGPHLHYEVFRDGRRVNPWPYLGRKGS